MQDIGLIGVGYIGKLFVDRLREADYPLTVYDVDEEQIAYAVERGAAAAASPAEVARESDVILLAVPGSPEVESTLEGTDGTVAGGTREEDGEGTGAAEDGLLSELGPGDLVIDATTTHPDTSVVAEERCAEVGADFLEAPITGGAPREGYHVMVGGTEERYEAAAEVLDVLCEDHARVGPVPKATVFKLGLQLRYAGRQALDAEIVEFLRDDGVDPGLLNDFLGFDVSERYFTGDFSQEIEGLGGLAIWHKDIGYARDYAFENGTALPLNGVVHEAYKATTRRVDDEEGHAAALVKYWQALNDAEDRYG